MPATKKDLEKQGLPSGGKSIIFYNLNHWQITYEWNILHFIIYRNVPLFFMHDILLKISI